MTRFLAVVTAGLLAVLLGALLIGTTLLLPSLPPMVEIVYSPPGRGNDPAGTVLLDRAGIIAYELAVFGILALCAGVFVLVSLRWLVAGVVGAVIALVVAVFYASAIGFSNIRSAAAVEASDDAVALAALAMIFVVGIGMVPVTLAAQAITTRVAVRRQPHRRD